MSTTGSVQAATRIARVFRSRCLLMGLGLVTVMLLGTLLFSGFSATRLALHTVWAQSGNILAEMSSRIVVTASRVGPAGPAVPADQVPAHLKVRYAVTDLAALQRELTFTIWQPEYLPEGSTLASVHKMTSRVEGLGVQLKYILSGGGGFMITQSEPAQPIHVYVEQDRILQKVDINGLQGIVYDPGGPPDSSTQRAILQWTDGSRWFEMRGSIGIDEMARVARSLAP